MLEKHRCLILLKGFLRKNIISFIICKTELYIRIIIINYTKLLPEINQAYKLYVITMTREHTLSFEQPRVI